MKFLIIIIILFLYKYFISMYRFTQEKEYLHYYLSEIEKRIIDDPKELTNYCRKGSLFLKLQDFPMAYNQFQYVIELINNLPNPKAYSYLLNDMQLNLQFASAPLPWSKFGPKDYRKSLFMFVMIKWFGKRRAEY